MHLYKAKLGNPERCRQNQPVLSKAHFPKTCLEGMDSQPTTCSMFISPEGKARPERVSAALLHGWRVQNQESRLEGQQDHLGTALETAARQHENKRNQMAKAQEVLSS